MSRDSKLLITSALVGGVCGMAGAALSVPWRFKLTSARDRAARVLGQLENIAERMQSTLSDEDLKTPTACVLRLLTSSVPTLIWQTGFHP